MKNPTLQRPRRSILLRAATVTLLFSVLVSAASENTLRAEALESGMPYDQRIRLAHRILDPIRSEVLKADDFRQRYPSFLVGYAELDPVWTARLLLDHPSPDDTVLYEHTALVALARKSEQLPEEDVLQLIAASKFMRANVALLAVEGLSRERETFREQIIQQGLARPERDVPMSPTSFESRLKLAAHSKDPQLLTRVKQQIAEFYTSGAADALKKTVPANQRPFIAATLQRFAPADFREAQAQPANSNTYGFAQTILQNDALSADEKLVQLRKLEDYSFGTHLHEMFAAASRLDPIALLDAQLAQAWADQAPNPATRAWAKLSIAPAVARDDAGAAARLIHDSYQELAKSPFVNSTPQSVACNGLFIVQAIRPELTAECLATTIQLVDRPSSRGPSSDRFTFIAAIAPFDHGGARSIFVKSASDVSLSDAAGFFKALLAVEPEDFWEEYESMPAKDRGGNDLKLRVRSAVLPALVKRDQREFWYELAKSPYLQMPSGILSASPN